MENRLSKPSVLRIQTFGPLKTWRHGQLLDWPTKKSKALIQILLVEPGKVVPTDQILEFLCPELLPQKAKNNLWVTVSQLRRVLQRLSRDQQFRLFSRSEIGCF